MAEFFRRLAANATLNRPAIIDPSSPPKQYSYGELLSRVTVFHEIFVSAAQKAQKQLDGARIGVMVPPGVNFVAAVLGTWSVRAIVVPICLTHPLQEITYTVTDSDQDFIIYHSDFHAKINPLLQERIGINVADIPQDARSRKTIDFSTLEWPLDAADSIIYTSGSTGAPKGVVQTAGSTEHSHRSLATAWQISAADRVLHVLPLHHGHGFNLALLLPLWEGATVEFMPKFDDSQVWKRFMDPSLPPITVVMAVPTIWVKMIAYFNRELKNDTARANKAREAAASLRLAISGSAALAAPVRNAWADIANGYLLLERYGSTESGILYTGRLDANGRVLGSVGWPTPGTRTRLVADDGKDVTNLPDIVGEIQVKTEGLMKEYWRRPGAKEKELTTDGWWKTGDLGLIKAEHNNALFIQGRASVDIIKSGGYKVSALDIEAAMLQLPFVAEVAVLGVPDAVWGEVVAAICVPVEGKSAELTIANVREKLRAGLAPYKIPQKLHILEVMPRNAMGKVQKKILREQCFPAKLESKL